MIVTVAGSAAVLVGGPRAPEPTVLLSGTLGYRPTVRAAQWFADRVWPGVCERLPTARWLLAGARPAPAIRALNGRTGIEVHGDVDELAPFLAGAWVAVAPMASGSGVPLKIIEALAAGVPVVADPWSAAGLEDPTAVTTATGEAQWVERVAGLLEDRDRARLKAERGTTLWRSVYHPDRVHETIRAAVNAVARSGD
jgi:glycosyltransferase involved in cell wall biosynthesis